MKKTMSVVIPDESNPQTWPVREVVGFAHYHGMYREILNCGHSGAAMMLRPEISKSRRCKECAVIAIRERQVYGPGRGRSEA